MTPAPVFVVGRFPPPADGQTLATERCASLLDATFDVHRLNTQAPPGSDPLSVTSGFNLRRTLHYASVGRRLAASLRQRPEAPVLWPSISPAPLGHLRDVLTTVPAFARAQPVAGVLHRAGFEDLFGSPLAASARRLVRRLDAVVFLNETLADRCAPHVPDAKRRVIPNTVRGAVVPSAEAVEARRQRGPGAPLQVLFLSNMLPEKGYLDVLDAVARLVGRGADVRARFVGRWPDESTHAAFLARAAHLGVADRVDVLGIVTDVDAVRGLLLDADVFVLPTTHPTEAQPVVLLEALSAGTPIVTVDRPVTRQILTDGVEGALVPPHAPDAIADAIARLTASDTWATVGAAARRRFDAAFAPAVVRDLWVGLLEELESRRR